MLKLADKNNTKQTLTETDATLSKNIQPYHKLEVQISTIFFEI